MALKKPQPKMDPQEFLTLFREAVGSGLADTMLPDFYDVIDERIRTYQGHNGSPLDADFYETLQIQRKLKFSGQRLAIGGDYGLLGSKYQGVEVLLLEQIDSNQCRVKVTKTLSPHPLDVGENYRVPAGALVPLEGS